MKTLVSATILIFTNILLAMPIEYKHPKFAHPNISSNDNFVVIKAGSFMMGTPNTEAFRGSNEILHKVTLTQDFEMQATVVTQGQFFSVMGYNPSFFVNKNNCPNEYIEINGVSLCPNNPVENVSWRIAEDFINQLNSLNNTDQYRLPTEAEWEYSARAGSQTTYWFGNSSKKINDYVWHRANSRSQTQAVGQKPANPWGLYDVHGNVWQWTNDWYAPYSSSEQTNPTTPHQTYLGRSTRGGSWESDAQTVRAGFRAYVRPEYNFSVLGFRLVRTKK